MIFYLNTALFSPTLQSQYVQIFFALSTAT